MSCSHSILFLSRYCKDSSRQHNTKTFILLFFRIILPREPLRLNILRIYKDQNIWKIGEEHMIYSYTVPDEAGDHTHSTFYRVLNFHLIAAPGYDYCWLMHDSVQYTHSNDQYVSIYKLDENGIHLPAKVIKVSSANDRLDKTVNSNAAIQLISSSPDGSSVALAYSTKKDITQKEPFNKPDIQIWDFDMKTGTLQNPFFFRLQTKVDRSLSSENINNMTFSYSGNFLYVPTEHSKFGNLYGKIDNRNGPLLRFNLTNRDRAVR